MSARRRRSALGLKPAFILGGGSNIVLRETAPARLKSRCRNADRRVARVGRDCRGRRRVNCTTSSLTPAPVARARDSLSFRDRRRGAVQKHRRLCVGEESFGASTPRFVTGRRVTLDLRSAPSLPRSVFKHALAGKSVNHSGSLPVSAAVAAVDRLPRAAEKKIAETQASRTRRRRQIFGWVVAIRRAQLPEHGDDRQPGSFLQGTGRHARAMPRHHRASIPESSTIAARRRRHKSPRRG